MLGRLLACLRPEPPPAAAQLCAAAALQQLRELVVCGGLRQDEGALLLAVATLLRAQELRVLDMKATCTELLAAAASGGRLSQGAAVQVGAHARRRQPQSFGRHLLEFAEGSTCLPARLLCPSCLSTPLSLSFLLSCLLPAGAAAR